MTEERLDSGTLERLAAVGGLTATVSDAFDELGFARRPVVEADVLLPRTPGAVAVGHAVTMRFLPARWTVSWAEAHATAASLGHDDLFDVAQPGDLLVIDAGGMPGVSTMGGIAAAQAKQHGLSGVVVDGAIRDIDEFRGLAFPAWSRSLTPRTGKWRLELAAVNEPVGCAGHQVRPGDLVIADESGVCVVPPELLERVVPIVLEVGAREVDMLRGAGARGSTA